MTAAKKFDIHSAEGRARADRLVLTLAITVFIEWLSAGAFLPLFPVYLTNHGASGAVIGLTMGSFFVAGVFFQYPAGQLADRTSRRKVLIGGQVLYAIATAGYLVTTAPGAIIALRFTQGIGAGASEVAALSIVATVVAPQRRGRAFSTIYGAQLSGTVVGPLIGAVFGLAHMRALFVVTAVMSVVATIPVLLRPELSHQDPSTAHRQRGPRQRLVVPKAAIGALFVAGALGLVIGVYDSSWSLLLHARGASNAVINLSWVLFSLPFVAATRPAGWLADHRDRKVLAIGAVLLEVSFCMTYPFVASVVLLLVLGAVEATVLATALPSAQSMLTEHVAEGQQGRIQGLYSTCQMAATAVAAMAAGSLFSIRIWLPFVTMAAVALVFVLAIAYSWRGVNGHVQRAATSPAAPTPDDAVEAGPVGTSS